MSATGAAQDAATDSLARLLAALAHQVNQPLMSISANAGAGLGWLRADPPRAEQVPALLLDIIAQSQRAGRVVQALQALGHGRPQRASVDLRPLVRDALARARAQFEAQNIAFALDLRAPDSRIDGDAGQLRQVLDHLLQNAIEALAPVQGRARLLRLALYADEDDDAVVLRLDDNGVGLADTSAAGLDALFQPLAGTKPGAIGMGLAVCRSIVEAHGGTIALRAGVPHGCSVLLRLDRGR